MPRSQRSQTAPQGQAGLVKRIHIKNFMCHDNLEINLNQRINFISGKNGSGKSAIQTALAIGLGGKALSTNRGNSLKDLIKTGKNSASIEITLSNLGIRAYKYEEYGSEVTVVRNLTQTSSSYKIKSATGAVRPLGREELNKMLAHFNIQVNNPISILHQDTSRNFLNSSDPRDKYKLFIQATQLDEVNRMNVETNININKVIEDIKKKTEALQKTFQDVKATESRLKILEQAKAKARRRDQLENKLFWALVAEASAVLKQKQETKKNLLEQIEALKLKLSDQGGEKSQLAEELENLTEELNKVAIEEDDVMTRCNKKRDELRERNYLYQNKKKENSVFEVRIGKLNENLKACENEINKFINSDKDKVRQKEENERKLVTLKEELVNIEAAEKTTTVELNQLEDTLEKIREEENQHVTSFQNTQFEIRKRNERINRLTKESDNLSEYHPAMPQMVKLIEKAFKDGKFTEKPLGPVGKFVSVVDESWAAPIENILGRSLLSSFCVNNNKDVEVLKSIFNSCCGNGQKPDIICSKFIDKVHDVSRNEIRAEGYSNVLRSLKISNPVIENFIIDQVEPETVLMIPTSDEAYHLMGNAQYVPKNCKRAFTKKGDLFFPYPNYRSYASTMKSKNAMLLQSSNADIVKTLKQQIMDLNNVSETNRLKRKEIEKKMIQVEKSLSSVNSRMEKLQTKKASLKAKINEIQLALHEPDFDTGISILTDEKNRIKTMIEETEAKQEAVKCEAKDLKDIVESLNADYSEQKKSVEEVYKRKNTLKKRIEEINDTLREMVSEKHKLQSNLKEKEDLVGSLEDEIKNQIELVEKRTNEASQLCERIETTMSVAEIQKELKPIKQYLDRLEEESGGTYEEVGKEFYEKKAKFDEISASLARLQSFFMNTRVSLNLRTETVKRIQEISAISTQHYFQAYLRQRNFKGIMEFSHEKKELKICVSPLGRDNMMTTSSLSGGEKSYSTVCFIMALWAELNFPFYFLDEFDVYMDMITRRTIMDMLITCAKDMFTSQFVFLTPLDMSHIHISEDVSVHKMIPPRR